MDEKYNHICKKFVWNIFIYLHAFACILYSHVKMIIKGYFPNGLISFCFTIGMIIHMCM